MAASALLMSRDAKAAIRVVSRAPAAAADKGLDEVVFGSLAGLQERAVAQRIPRADVSAGSLEAGGGSHGMRLCLAVV